MSKKELPRGVPEVQTPIPGGGDSMGPPPPHGTPRPADTGAPVPRTCHPLDRVDTKSGVSRFKIQAKNYAPQPLLYVVAKNEAQASEHYLKDSGLGAQLDRLKKTAGPDGKVEPPDLVVTQLVD